MKSKPSIRLFADAHVFDKEYQGTRTFLKEIYSHLAYKNDIQLYLRASDTEKLRAIFPTDANINFLSYKNSSSFARLAYTIPSIIKKYKIDVAHFQYIIPPIKLCRYLVTIHDVIFNEYPDEFSLQYRLLKKFLFKKAAQNADIVTTVSDYSKASIRKWLIPGKQEIHVIPNGVSKRYFEQYDRQRSRQLISEKYGLENIILYVSRLEPRKNHVGLLRAWLELKLYEQGYYLALLGHRSLNIPEFDELLNSLPPQIARFIFMSSTVDDNDLLEFYRAASVFVYPSKAEGFGICPLEAGALGIPVICSNTSAMKGYTFFGENHIDPFNQELLTDRLQKLLKSEPDRDHLMIISDIIRQNYSWEQSAEKLYHLLLYPELSGSGRKLTKYDQPSVPGR